MGLKFEHPGRIRSGATTGLAPDDQGFGHISPAPRGGSGLSGGEGCPL